MLTPPDTSRLFQQVPLEIVLITGGLLIWIIFIHGLYDHVLYRRFRNALQLMEGVA
jgi:hypothetical protein